MSKAIRSVNIPRTVTDDFYRYKMPELIAKIEGRGNGIKTVLVNISDVAKALKRPPAYPTKFMGFQLGALTTTDEKADRYIVNGKHDHSKLTSLLDEFIDKYVLCHTCRNPETNMILTRAGDIELRCLACGNVTHVTGADKMGTFIVKNPPASAAEAERLKKLQRQKREAEEREIKQTAEELGKIVKAKKKNADAEDDDGDWAIDVSAEAVKARRNEMIGGTAIAAVVATDDAAAAAAAAPAPVERAKTPEVPAVVEAPKRAKTPEAHKPEPVMDEATWLAEVEKVSDPAAAQKLAAQHSEAHAKATAALVATFSQSVLKEVLPRAPLLAPFAKSAPAQEAILEGLVTLLAREPAVSKDLPAVLSALYDKDVLEEENIIAWKDRRLPEAIKDEKLRNFLVGSASFIDWLEEDDDEEEEEGEEADEDEEEDS